MSLRRLALLLPVIAFASLHAQTNTFELHVEGKKIGMDTYTLAKAKRGYKLMSHLEGSIHGSDLDFRDTLSYDDVYAYLDGAQTSQASNQQTSWIPSKDGKEITIAASAGGRTSSNFEPITPNLVVLPAFDAGAAQALLLFITNHPTEKNLYSLYLPMGYSPAGGRGGGRGAEPPDASGANTGSEDSLPAGVHCFTALWAKGGPLTGTRDGNPVNVNTYLLAFGKFRWLFFADEANNLMQVNVSLLHASYIRSNFKLDPPKQAMPR
jgi:hypothetical protein